MSYLKKLIEISSDPKETYIGSDIPNKLMELYKHKDGFVAFENSLRIYPKTECDYINNIIGKLVSNNIYIFGDNALGDLFCLYEDIFFRYDLELNEFEELGDTLEIFSEKILSDYNYYTGYSLCYEWMINNRELHWHEILMPRIPFSVGGEYSIENLMAYSKMAGFEIKIMFSHKIKNFRDGDKIDLSNYYPL